MKYFFLILLSFSAFAREHVSFTSYGNTYYACSFAQDLAYGHLEVLGGKNVEVYCTGGFQTWGMSRPVSVHASFDLPLTTQVTEQVELEGGDCALNAQMIKAFIRMIPTVQIVKRSDACMSTRSRYYYLLNITR